MNIASKILTTERPSGWPSTPEAWFRFSSSAGTCLEGIDVVTDVSDTGVDVVGGVGVVVSGVVVVVTR